MTDPANARAQEHAGLPYTQASLLDSCAQALRHLHAIGPQAPL